MLSREDEYEYYDYEEDNLQPINIGIVNLCISTIFIVSFANIVQYIMLDNVK